MHRHYHSLTLACLRTVRDGIYGIPVGMSSVAIAMIGYSYREHDHRLYVHVHVAMYGRIVSLLSNTPPDRVVFAALQLSALPYLGDG